MVALGILVTNLSQEHEYFTDIASSGKKKNVNVHLFLPSEVDLENKVAKGKKYCLISDSWVDSIFPIPKFIYDRCFYKNEAIFKKNFPIVSWLKSQSDIQFIGHGLPNKWVVYNSLNNIENISCFLPETELLQNSQQAFSLLAKHGSLLFKPVSGSQGKGIFILTKRSEGFSLLIKKKQEPYIKQISRGEIEHLIIKVKKKQYLLQPFLSLSNDDKCPFDLRVFLQKDENGEWKEIGRGIRTGKKGDFTSNLGGGGQVTSFKNWYSSLKGDFQNNLEEFLPLLLQQIPETLEKQGFQLFELGLDFGFDRDGKLWLLEVNSKPGRKVILNNFPTKKNTLSEAPINYTLYLSAKSL